MTSSLQYQPKTHDKTQRYAGIFGTWARDKTLGKRIIL